MEKFVLYELGAIAVTVRWCGSSPCTVCMGFLASGEVRWRNAFHLKTQGSGDGGSGLGDMNVAIFRVYDTIRGGRSW